MDGIPGLLHAAGNHIPASSGETFDVHNPATGTVVATLAEASAEDVRRALDAAVGAAASWAGTAPRVRAGILHRVWDLLQERRQQFAELITTEMGKPLSEALSEVDYAANYVRWFAEEAVRLSGRTGLTPEGSGRMDVSPYPVGPCYLITPWNFPLTMAARKISPALAAGCTIVLKPSELTPLSSLYLARLFEEAGLPAGVLSVVTTTRAAAVSEILLSDPRLRKISFTGSTAVGRILLRQASDNVLRTSMELGGNAPFIVFHDADLDAAVSGALEAKFRNSGQACTAANRFIVQRSVVEEFTRKLTLEVQKLKVGPGMDPASQLGPLINDQAVHKIDELVRDAVAGGAHIETGGRPLPAPGSYYAPTVLSSVAAGQEIFHSEIFGPVVTITVFEDEAEAIELANGTELGLVAYVYTSNPERSDRLAESLEVGMLGMNVGIVSNVAAPFGGVKQSGLGREGGTEGIHEYLAIKYTLRPRKTAP